MRNRPNSHSSSDSSTQPSVIASAAVGSFVRLTAVLIAVFITAGAARAQAVRQPATPQVARVASLPSGSIAGVVQDERGDGIGGAVVSAVGSTRAFAVTDRSGRFELRTLTPGAYLVRAHVSGFTASRGQIVEVRPSARVSSSIALHHVADAEPKPSTVPVLAAGMGAPGLSLPGSEPASPAVPAEAAAPDTGAGNDSAGAGDDHGEVAWKIRHARRGILRDATLPVDLVDAAGFPAFDGSGSSRHGLLGRAADSSARLLAGMPFSGQVNLLTSGSFDTPQQLFSGDGFGRGIAYLSLRTPASARADWTVRGALTPGDVSSWIVAAAYATKVPATHRYDIGVSYSAQQSQAGAPGIFQGVFQGEAPAGGVLRDPSSGGRSAGTVYGFDTFTVTPAVSFTYGARFDRYDYLNNPGLISSRVALDVSPADHVRIHAVASRRATAPGAEEFVPAVDAAVWLPPQRTFSSLAQDQTLDAEHTNHLELGIEGDLLGSTVSLRTFHQHAADQTATIFGVDLPGTPAARLGRYFVASAGDVDTTGWSAGIRTPSSRRLHGSVEYSQARANWAQGADLAYLILLAPSAARMGAESIRDVAATLETLVPETSTRVLVLYRVGNGFASAGEHPAFDSRFDVQVHQSLPFMDFSSAKWEVLLAVRNVFREANLDASVFDELLVVRPPKRIVGGLTLRF